jgi:hypothetical protein
MPKDDEGNNPDPLLAGTDRLPDSEDLAARVIIGTHSSEVTRAIESFNDDMGGPPYPGGWKRPRSF